jgi:1,4-dihydroxy-2-naphthoate polyprenyltransferase
MNSPNPRLITLKKTNVDFNRYLMGTFSETEVAIPIQSLNLGTQNETVTFEIVPLDQIQRPNYFLYWLHLIKLKSFLFFLLPLFAVLTKNYVDDSLRDPLSLLFTIIGGVLIFAGFNIRQDVNDHVSGFDRVFSPSVPKPILRGWITASEASFLSWFLIGLGVLICIPSFLLQQELIRVAIVLSLIFIVARFAFRNSFKTREVGEVAMFLLAGPGICSAFQVALGSGVDTEILAFGVLWGFAVLFLVHLNNFVYLMESEKFGLENAMIKYGFDQSKKFLVFWWILFVVLWILFHFFYSATYMMWFTSGLMIFWSIPTLIKFAEIQSPLGSDLFEAREKGKRNFYLMVMLYGLEQIFYVIVKMGWISL